MERRDVDWTRANCRGMDTELFYKQPSELLEMGLHITTLRRICFNCPIWAECLEVATKYERYGTWGGLTEMERNQVYNGSPDRSYFRLKRDLEYVGKIKIKEIINIIKGVKRNYGDFGYKFAKKND